MSRIRVKIFDNTIAKNVTMEFCSSVTIAYALVAAERTHFDWGHNKHICRLNGESVNNEDISSLLLHDGDRISVTKFGLRGSPGYDFPRTMEMMAQAEDAMSTALNWIKCVIPRNKIQGQLYYICVRFFGLLPKIFGEMPERSLVIKATYDLGVDTCGDEKVIEFLDGTVVIGEVIEPSKTKQILWNVKRSFTLEELKHVALQEKA